jgi:FkbM family methyltransferase
MASQSRLLTFALKGFITLCLLATAAWTTLAFYPGLAILPFAGRVKRSPYCDVWQAVQNAQVKVDQRQSEKQIRSQSRLVRTDGNLRLWTTPDGEFWIPGANDSILAILLAQQRRNIYGDVASGGVRTGDVVIDCGAHVGTYARAALRAGAAKVIAVEPSPEAVECLRRNFEKEAADGRLVIYAKGVWDEEKRLVFYENGNGAAGDSFITAGRNAKPVADIPVTTIDKIVAELGLNKVDLIKADIKGAGVRMIHGADRTIRLHHPRLVISTEEAPEDPAAINAAVLAIAPNYTRHCGPCLFDGDEIRTDTIRFQ